MRSIASKRPTPAFVVALVALFVALGGTGYAAVSINGKSIRPHTILGNRLKANTLTGAQVDESKLGVVPFADHAHGADHAAGADDAKTLGGHPASSLLSNATVVHAIDTDTIMPGQGADVKAHCASNEHGISGGAAWLAANDLTFSLADLPVTVSTPLGADLNGNPSRIDGWEASGDNASNSVKVLRVYVICVRDNA
jgi:hypothetical protein